ncbi:cytochrome P450 [Cristinia sonorae]|uniref:Cytochrome P450 n=1 Tax=Cristinia sonorae TaxID=1940300 RepID=A0A8K0UTL0_9AGAR|nr:cytochrome P450 [Cristinia sonorae]
MAFSLTLLDSTLLLIAVLLLRRIIFRRNRPPLPPGPKALPLVGNVLDMPSSYEWLTFIDWSKKWGDILSVTLLGQTIVILGSPKHAFELLEKRSTTYSDRPILVMCGELMGWDQALALTHYGDRFREYRRLLGRLIGSKALVKQFHSLIEQETHRFLSRVLRNPDGVAAHIRNSIGATILMISYGHKVSLEEGSDPYIDQVNEAMEQFTIASTPGAFLVDILPVLKYVPAWFPGASFKRKASAWRKSLLTTADVPFEDVKKQMDAGTHIESFTSMNLASEKDELDDAKIHSIKWTAASLYAGGADTSVSAIYGFFLAMTLFPEAQRKAQEEIDEVIGSDRLPMVEDRDNLPYVEALVKEVFRFNPVAPLGLPHRVSEDDVYEGYFIPKGTMVLANIWQFLHDPEVYHDPMNFQPDRFLSKEGHLPERDPRELCFGYGRRLCPGVHLADVSVWTSCAMSLAVFDISPVVENGKVVEVKNEYLSGTVSHPKPFRCTIKPRSPKADALIRTAEYL